MSKVTHRRTRGEKQKHALVIPFFDPSTKKLLDAASVALLRAHAILMVKDREAAKSMQPALKNAWIRVGALPVTPANHGIARLYIDSLSHVERTLDALEELVSGSPVVKRSNVIDLATYRMQRSA